MSQDNVVHNRNLPLLESKRKHILLFLRQRKTPSGIYTMKEKYESKYPQWN